MAKNDEKWLANYEALKAYIDEHHHLPDKHKVENRWAALMFEDETGIARWFLERIKLIYIFEKQYKKDRLSVEIIEARR